MRGMLGPAEHLGNAPSGGPVPIIHVEVGGTWGGSLRILELQLMHADRNRFTHDVLLYYPTPGSERLRAVARNVWALYNSPPERTVSAPGLKWRLMAKRLIGTNPQWYPWVQLPAQFRIARRISALLKRLDCRLVHVNNTFSYQAATLLAARMAHLPVVSHTRNPVVDSLLNRRLIRLTRYVATANHKSERHLTSWRSGVAIRTCYEPTECPVPDPVAVADVQRSFVPEGGFLIGSIGRLDEQKGFKHLVRAARTVLDRHPLGRFAVAGEGPERPRLQALVNELGLTGRFQFCAFRPDSHNFLAALDLFVCPSLWEGSPLSLVEAILLGKPVVTTDVGIAGTLIPRNGEELVTPGDPAALARAILAALEKNSAARRRISETRERAMQMADPVHTTREMEEIFSSVLSAWTREPSGSGHMCRLSPLRTARG